MPRWDGARLDFASFRTPPLTVKGRKVGGVWDPLLTIDLGGAGSAADLGAFFKHHVGPPPPPAKGRMVGGVQESPVDRLITH
jgi:hypothetical protein